MVRFSFACMMLLLPSIGMVGGTLAADLRLRDQCVPAGPVVKLGDIAEIAADAAQAQSLAAIELFSAPAAGNQRFLRLREIQDLLLLRGVNLTEHRISGASQVLIRGNQPARAEIEAPTTAAVTRKANLKAREVILQYLREHVSAEEPWTVEVALSPAQIRALADYTGTVTAIGGAAPFTGAQQFELSLKQGEQTQRFAVEASVSMPPAVLMVTHDLPRGAMIRETDVELQRVAINQPAAETFADISEVLGRETTRAISAGKPLSRDAIRAMPLVHRGDVVTVYARSPGIQVRTTGRAKDDGASGELVAVESFHNRQAFFARVCGIREVELFAHAEQIESQAADVPAAKPAIAQSAKPAAKSAVKPAAAIVPAGAANGDASGKSNVKPAIHQQTSSQGSENGRRNPH